MIEASRRRAPWAFVALSSLVVPAALQASGFALESQGARAMGFAGAYVAQASDPTAIYFNAAGIGFLERPQLYVGAAFAGLSTDFTGIGPNPPAGTLEQSSRGLGMLPTIYYAHPLGPKTVLGMGINMPFGNRSQWDNPNEFTGRYICLDCRIRSFAVNPTVAYKVADRLAVGGGLDVRFSTFDFTRRLAASPTAFPEPTDVAQLSLASGTDTGLGFNLGLLASPTENVSVGLSYRHKVTIEHDAEAGFVQILTGNRTVDDAVALTLPGAEPATVAFTYPGSVAAGIAWRRGDWTVEGDLAWTLWSSFDRVTIRFPNAPTFDTVLPQDYESTWRGAVGVEYLVGKQWEVRAGYAYDHSPAPTPTISPFIHDADRHAFGAGGSWKQGFLRLDLFARYLFFSTSSTLGLSRYDFNGAYKTNGFQVGAGLGYRF